jgi:hypothetical protein
MEESPICLTSIRILFTHRALGRGSFGKHDGFSLGQQLVFMHGQSRWDKVRGTLKTKNRVAGVYHGLKELVLNALCTAPGCRSEAELNQLLSYFGMVPSLRGMSAGLVSFPHMFLM